VSVIVTLAVASVVLDVDSPLPVVVSEVGPVKVSSMRPPSSPAQAAAPTQSQANVDVTIQSLCRSQSIVDLPTT
jgi:hypothetical protein